MPVFFDRRKHYPIHRPPPSDPKDITFQTGDHVVVRVLDVPHVHPALDWFHRRCVHPVPWLNRWLSHHVIEIYARASQCMYTMGVGIHRRKHRGGTRRRGLFVQTPDRKWLVSRKRACTHVPVLPTDTAHTRMQRLRDLGLVVHHTRLTPAHVACLARYVQRVRPHGKRAWRHAGDRATFALLANVWETFGVRAPNTHNCQTFAEQFVRAPATLFT